MIVIALGGNLTYAGSPPQRTLEAALDALQEGGDVRIAARSPWYSSPAWPDPSGPRYVNGVAVVETSLAPAALLARLHAVEDRFGRQRSADDRWASRTLDLDLIDYDRRVEQGADLTLPHPRLEGRAFVLLPLRDIAPGWRTPDGRGLDALIAALPPDDIAATQVLQTAQMP